MARVSFHARMKRTSRASSWTRTREGRRGHLLGTRILSCALAHGDVGIWSPLLCTLVQCRCGHSSPNDAGVWALEMQASEPKCLPLGSSIDTGVHPCVLALTLTLELTFSLHI